MLTGIKVVILRPTEDGVDRFGNKVKGEPVRQTVENVLVSPGSTNDMEAARPDGTTVAYTLHFPKTYTGSLRNCEVELPPPWAGVYRVIGDPREYIDANTPTKWHMPVEVEDANG